MTKATDLQECWVQEGGKMVARGDAKAIDNLLATKLVQVRTVDAGWTIIYRHKETNQLWELSRPQSELHAGGPRRLRLLT